MRILVSANFRQQKRGGSALWCPSKPGCPSGIFCFKTKQIRRTNTKRGGKAGSWIKATARDVVMTPGLFSPQECFDLPGKAELPGWNSGARPTHGTRLFVAWAASPPPCHSWIPLIPRIMTIPLSSRYDSHPPPTFRQLVGCSRTCGCVTVRQTSSLRYVFLFFFFILMQL